MTSLCSFLFFLFSAAYHTVQKRFHLFTMMLQDLHNFKCDFQSLF